jgi:hypothetical protein
MSFAGFRPGCPPPDSVPLDEQIEIVGEQFYPKEIRKLFRE